MIFAMWFVICRAQSVAENLTHLAEDLIFVSAAAIMELVFITLQCWCNLGLYLVSAIRNWLKMASRWRYAIFQPIPAYFSLFQTI